MTVVIEASMAQKLLCHSPCKQGLAGSIPGSSNLSDETLDFKLRSRLHITLAVGGTLNPLNQPINN